MYDWPMYSPAFWEQELLCRPCSMKLERTVSNFLKTFAVLRIVLSCFQSHARQEPHSSKEQGTYATRYTWHSPTLIPHANWPVHDPSGTTMTSNSCPGTAMKTFSPLERTVSFSMEPVWASFTQTQSRNRSASKNILLTFQECPIAMQRLWELLCSLVS